MPGGCEALVDGGPGSLSSWQGAPQSVRREPELCRAAPEKVCLEHMHFLLMAETTRAGGASRSPCPGLLPPHSGIPDHLRHPEQFILLVLYTFIWKERHPFPKQSLKVCHLDRSPLQSSRPAFSPLPSHHDLACLQ